MGLRLGLGLTLAPGGHASSSSGSGGGAPPLVPALIANTKIAPAGNDGGTSASINTTGANLIVAALCLSATTTGGPTFSDSKSNTWTLLTTATSATENIALYYCASPTVGSGHTFTTGPGFPNHPFSSACIAAFSNVKPSGPLDQNNGGASTAPALTVQPVSITPVTNGELLICVLGTAPVGAETAAINSGFTKTDDAPFNPGNAFGSHMAYLVQNTAAAINPTWTVSGTTTSNPLVSAIASFKPGP